MAIRRRTIRQMSPVARKLARFVNEFQSITRRLKYLLSDIQDLEFVVKVQSFKQKEEDDVFPQDPRGLDTENLSSGEKRQGRHDQVGKPGNRRGTAARGRPRRPRNKRKRLSKEKRNHDDTEIGEKIEEKGVRQNDPV